MSSNFGIILPLTTDLAALERLKKTCNLVSTLEFVFGTILPWAAELAALEHLKIFHILIMGKILLAL